MPHWLKAILPDWLERAGASFAHPKVLIGMTIGAGVLFVLSIVLTPWVISKLPRDYFKRHYDFVSQLIKNKKLRVLARVGKNVIGAVLLLAGIVMLLAPGPGILCILMAIVLLDFPGKHSLERKLVTRPKVLRTMNKLRRKMGKDPLVV
jgi:hypothetical protein